MKTFMAIAVLAAGAGLLGARAEDHRRILGFSQASAPGTLKPGQAAGVALLGGFRGLYVDTLWYRAEGRFMDPAHPFYEIPMLYALIGELQPHYPEMWYYTAHRMAFDIPKLLPRRSAEGDAVWALRGVDHLKEGIALNAGHPGIAKLRFNLADIYHRRCTPNRYAPYGDEALRRLKEARGEDAYDRAVQLVHEIRDDPEALPAWLAEAGHVRFEEAVHAPTPELEDLRLAQAREEWDWVRQLYESPAPVNRYVRRDPRRYRDQVPLFKEKFLDLADRQRQALRLEQEGRPEEARAIWTSLMRHAVLDASHPEPLSEKHLRRMGALAEVYESLARELAGAGREPLVQALREAAGRERKGN